MPEQKRPLPQNPRSPQALAPGLWVLTALLALPVGACSTSFTNMAPTRTYAPGQGQASLGYQLDVQPSAIERIVEAGERAQDLVKNTPEGESVAEEAARELLDAALLSRLFLSVGAPEVQGRLGARRP